MIIPLSFFLIFAILPTITKQAQPIYSSKESKIDWSECYTYKGCFCYDGRELIKQREKIEAAENISPPPRKAEIGKCDVGIQTRFINGEITLFKMQIIGTKDALGPNPTLMLYQGTNKMFGCKYDPKSGTAVLVGDTTFLKKYSISLFEDISIFEDIKGERNYFCAVKIAQFKRMVTMMDDVNNYKYRHVDPIMKLIMNNEEESPLKKYTQDRLEMYYDLSSIVKRPYGKCDTYAFKDLPSSDNYHVLPLINRDKDVLSCKDTHVMRYEVSGTEGEMEKLKCELKASTNLNNPYDPLLHNFVIVRSDPYSETGKTETIINEEDNYKYTFYCAAPFEQGCLLPDFGCEQGANDCPVYTPGKKGQRAELTCPDNKWLVKSEYYVIAENAVCSYQKRAKNQAAFILTLPTGVKIETRGEEFRCFTDYDCMKKSPISIPPTAVNSDGIVKCRDSAIDLRIHDYAANTTLTARTFACDKTSGEWRNTTAGGAMAEPIRGGSQITCPENEAKFHNQAEATLTDAQIYAIIIASGFVIFCMAMIISFSVRYCLMHRKHDSIDAQAFLKKTKAERLEHCRKFFPEVLKTSTTSAVHINNGLMELDMLLNLEIEDPEIWNLVYPFLMRVHGTIRRVDKHCWHMLTRYLYLQAKKIIDKHGWISPKPITRKSQKGTIRTVAINLLTFALADPRNKRRSEKLLLSGARKLGFRMNEQYPHCGVLLSVLSYTRVNCKIVNKAGKSRHLRMDDYLKILEEIATKSTITIPDYEVIPAFGSVAQQAAFACGGVQMLGFHIEHAKVLTLEKLVEGGKIAVSYVAGLSNSIYRSPAQPLLLAFRLTERSNPNVMKRLCDVAPEADWNKTIEQALRIAVYYGRHLDAKRIEQRFVPKVTQPTTLLTGLTLDQNEFELALDFQLEELREWFAAHTDIDEFKKEPAYAMTDKFKQDNRKEVVDKETTAGDGCGSEIKSGQASDSTDVKSPATPDLKSSASASCDSKGKEPAATEAAPPVAAVVATSPAPATNPASSPA